MLLLLWIVALIIGVYGIRRILGGDVLIGALLIVLAFAVGPGGWTIWR